MARPVASLNNITIEASEFRLLLAELLAKVRELGEDEVARRGSADPSTRT